MSRRHSDPGPDPDSEEDRGDLMTPHPHYGDGQASGLDLEAGLHLYPLPAEHKKDREALRFRADFEEDIAAHHPMGGERLQHRHRVRVVHTESPDYLRQLSWFRTKSAGFPVVAAQELVNPMGWHSGLALVSHNCRMLVVRTDPVWHGEWHLRVEKELLDYLRSRKSILATGGTLYRLGLLDLPTYDLVSTAVRVLAFPSRHWFNRYTCESAVNLGIWAPLEVMWGKFVGYVMDEEHLQDIQALFPQREPISPNMILDRVTDWKEELQPHGLQFLYHTGSCYWANIKLHFMQYVSQGYISPKSYDSSLLAFTEVKVSGRLPPIELPADVGSTESNNRYPRKFFMERARAVTRALYYPEPEQPRRAVVVAPQPPGAPVGPEPIYPLGLPPQPQGLEEDVPRTRGRGGQLNRGGRHIPNWDLDPEKVPDRYLPEKYRSVAALAPFCPTCGSEEHTKRKCPVLLELKQDGRGELDVECLYPLCKRRKHLLQVCPTLHALCTCGCRGHLPEHCHRFSSHVKESAYREYKAQGAGYSRYLNHPDWGYEGPPIQKNQLVAAYTDYAGYMFIEPRSVPDVLASTTPKELREAIHKAHFY